MSRAIVLTVMLSVLSGVVRAQPKVDTSRGDAMLAAYFREETAKLADTCLSHDTKLADWQKHRETYRAQLLEGTRSRFIGDMIAGERGTT